MQIKLDNVTYKNLNLDFVIENNKITGLVSNDINTLTTINDVIKNNTVDGGSIKYIKKSKKNTIGLISISDVENIIDGNCYAFLNAEQIDEEMYKLVNINKKVLEKDISHLSTTEKIKLVILKCLIEDHDTILIDGILEQLDEVQRKNIIKLLINLKKFNEKTILISSVDIDLIYEFIDSLIIVIDGRCLTSKDKYTIFKDNNIININKPLVKQIEEMVYNKSNINLGNNDSINELIKSIYREIR